MCVWVGRAQERNENESEREGRQAGAKALWIRWLVAIVVVAATVRNKPNYYSISILFRLSRRRRELVPVMIVVVAASLWLMAIFIELPKRET